ncbi:MAG TPA: hypothetical protein VL949_13555 [Geobacteraceae bacterium]|nr:hypothetical protein [Geobacteraceae bacterium]
MPHRSCPSQSLHDSMIKQLAEHLIGKKFRDVRADHPDFRDKPARIPGQGDFAGLVPDVTATGIQMVLFEVETDDSLNDPHTNEQWKLFSSFADQHMADFWVVVPKAMKDEARERVSTLGVNAKVMGI